MRRTGSSTLRKRWTLSELTYRTFHTISSKEDIFKKLEEVAAELSEDMEASGWTGKTVTLKYKLDTYQGVLPSTFSNCY